MVGISRRSGFPDWDLFSHDGIQAGYSQQSQIPNFERPIFMPQLIAETTRLSLSAIFIGGLCAAAMTSAVMLALAPQFPDAHTGALKAQAAFQSLPQDQEQSRRGASH